MSGSGRTASGRFTAWLARALRPVIGTARQPLAAKLGERPLATPRGSVAAAPALDRVGLAKFDHLVVLMLENRSFDQMLGYLSLRDRADIDGLAGAETNGHAGREYGVHHLDRTALSGEAEDPCHSPGCVDEQLGGGSSGFVSSFAKHLARAGAGAADIDPGLVMGYYDESDLPVYDFLAREFCVCDRWFSSVPGATWPNRLYAVTGGAAGSREDINPPIYNRVAFTRHLDKRGIDWRWYSYDPATLRLIDAEYRLAHHDHFSFFDRRKLSAREEAAGLVFEQGPSFIHDAATGRLPSVSWIDPRFKDMRVFSPDSNDDHPPSDVLAGQDLALTLYNALRSGPAWERTLLVITYDEHGGFYDHVAPPAAADDDPRFRRYGVRVPALVVSPWVERAAVSHAVLDHTSIIRTVLERFCEHDGQIPDMGARVSGARTLATLLTRTEPAETASHVELAARMTEWRAGFATARFTNAPQQGPRMTDLQAGFLAAATELRRRGLPPGHP